jgi:hypothetical protein
MTASEQQYGISPKRGPGIVYKDDIILMEHGDRAIRSYSSNGLGWTFDANAPQVSDIQVGKIVFATGRAVGRVLAMQREGDQVSVILGPVQLTDLVQRGKFLYDQPLDLNQAVVVATPDEPGAVNSKEMQAQAKAPGAQSSKRESASPWHVAQYYVVSDSGKWTPMRTIGRSSVPVPRLARANFHPSRRSFAMQAGVIPNVPAPPALPTPPTLPTLPTQPNPADLWKFVPGPRVLPLPGIPTLPFNDMQATPCGDCGGIGLKLYQEKDGVRVWVTAVFHLIHPHVIFSAAIDNGGIGANLQIAGGAGFSIKLDAASSQALSGNIHELGLIPLTINVPIGGIFLPLTIQLSQAVNLESAFSAKTSTLHGEGNISLSGEIMADYHGGKWDLTAPKPSVEANLASMVSGVSVGINSLVFGVRQRMLIGVGAGGFATGPYADLTSSITSLRGSSIGFNLMNGARVCSQGTFNMSLSAGIGYSMPKIVAAVINTVLGWFGVKPIQSSGSIVQIPGRLPLLDYRDELPAGCAGK